MALSNANHNLFCVAEFVDKFSDTLKYIDCCYFNSNETLIDALVSCDALIYIYMIGCPGKQRS